MSTPNDTPTVLAGSAAPPTGSAGSVGRSQRYMHRFVALAALVALTVVALPQHAMATSTTLLFDGVLRGSGNTPASDGKYNLTFSLYDSQNAQAALWSETASLVVASGQFSHPLGSVKPLKTGLIAAKSQIWIGVRVGQEPELPRQALHASLWALSAMTAATAQGLSCTACVPVSALKITDNIDLGAFGLKAKSLSAQSISTQTLTTQTLTAQTLTAQTVSATSFIGDGSKLTGIALPTGSCKAGLVVAGIAADGSLKCVSTAATLPNDGLNEISNNLLTTQFNETFPIPGNDIGRKIPDNTGIELVSTITVADVGNADGPIQVDINLVNSDLSKVSMVLLTPKDKKVGIILCDPCGKPGVKVLKTTFAKPTAVKTGDLSAWIGKSPKGTWNLRIADTGFCVAQLDKINCDVKGGTDGKLLSWALRFQVQSKKLVGVQGTLVVQGKGSPHTSVASFTPKQLDQAALVAGFPGLWTLVLPNWTAQNAVATPGQMVYRTDLKKTFVMQGKAWRELLTGPMCGDSVRAGAEKCDTADINSKSCADIRGIGSTGTLLCKTDCSDYDVTKCSQPPHFVGSKILKGTDIDRLIKMYGNTKQLWTLCYRRSDHGAASSTFHSRCDNKGPTMAIMKNSLGKVFGGYAPVSWNTSSRWTTSTAGFLFSLTNNIKFPYYKNSNRAMYRSTSYGPTFGPNHDLYVPNNMTSGGYGNPGGTYRCPSCPTTSCTACQNAFTGKYSGWTYTEIEVWYRK